MANEIFPSVLYALFDLRYAQIGGGYQGAISRARSITAKTGTYTLLVTDEIVEGSGTFTLNLPQMSSVSTASQSKEYSLLNNGSGTITITPYSGNTINSLSSFSLAAGVQITIIGNGGTDWMLKKAPTAVLADTATSATSATNATNAANATNADNLEVDGTTMRTASATAGANKIPCADANGKLDTWISPYAQQLYRIPNALAKSYLTNQNAGWVMRDGTVRMAGSGGLFALGLGTSVSDHYSAVQPGFPQILGTTVSELHISGNSCYALMANGDVYSWGTNTYGQLGQGHTNTVYTPTKITALSNIASITLSQANGTHPGYVTAFFLTTSGVAYACGFNAYGQCGNGNTSNLNTPTMLTGSTGWKNISVGCNYYTSCHAITATDTAVSWGYNLHGTLGQGNLTPWTSFNAVSGLTNVSKIVCQGDASYGSIVTYWLLTNGQVWAAGYNRFGELGLGTASTDISTPARITTNLPAISDIVCNGGNGPHTIALVTSDGSLRSWGQTTYGQTGQNTTTNVTPAASMVPVTVSISGSPVISKIWASGTGSYGISYAQDSTGKIWSCGYNAYGQLAVGNAVNQQIFTPILGVNFPNASIVSDIQFFGQDNTMAAMFLLADGRALAAGYNWTGMLSIYQNPAANVSSYVPTIVNF
jgi:alpha-tubulin suppressor-like RCC1 family protein